jgi:hypothetical protein
LKNIAAVDWEELSRINFVLEDNCWKKCKISCCKSQITDFRIMKDLGSWVLCMPEEYLHFKKRARLHGITFLSELKERKVEIVLNNGVKFGCIWRHCRYDGLCKGSMSKSLVCELYPFLPIMDIDGKLTDISLLMITDITVQLMGFERLCPIILEKDKYLKLWQNEPHFIAPLRHPYILFHLMAAKLVLDNFRESFLNNSKLVSKSGPEFWQAWEFEYLAGRLLDKNWLIASVSDLYEKFLVRYDGFSL